MTTLITFFPIYYYTTSTTNTTTTILVYYIIIVFMMLNFLGSIPYVPTYSIEDLSKSVSRMSLRRSNVQRNRNSLIISSSFDAPNPLDSGVGRSIYLTASTSTPDAFARITTATATVSSPSEVIDSDTATTSAPAGKTFLSLPLSPSCIICICSKNNNIYNNYFR